MAKWYKRRIANHKAYVTILAPEGPVKTRIHWSPKEDRIRQRIASSSSARYRQAYASATQPLPKPAPALAPEAKLYKVTVTATEDYAGESPLILEARAIGYAETKEEARLLAIELKSKLEEAINSEFNTGIATMLSIDSPAIETVQQKGSHEIIMNWKHSPLEGEKSRQLTL